MNLLSLTLTATGHQQTQEKQDGWILASADRTLSVTLYPNLVAIQTTRYDHYRVSLGVPLARALALFVATTGSSVVNRIGLRFINRLQDPLADKPEFWAAHIRDGFSGPLTGSLSRMVDATHQQTQIRLAESAAARIISGVFREEDGDRYSFLVDLDVFREQAFPTTRICARTWPSNLTGRRCPCSRRSSHPPTSTQWEASQWRRGNDTSRAHPDRR